MTLSDMPQVCVQSDVESVCRAAAGSTVTLAKEIVDQRGGFVLALCGGRTIRGYLDLLGTDYREQMPWSHTHIFWSDERYVPPEDPESNYGLARRLLLDRVDIPGDNVHPMPTLLPSPEEAADAYEEELTSWFSGKTPRFDLMVMGMGAEGHTASIFPHSPALEPEAQAHLVVAVEVPATPPWRLTMTLPVFNNAENLFFLVAGKEKAEALEHVVMGPPDPAQWPASGIRPTDGSVMWWVDEAAFGTKGRQAA
jgi:6-phosphogluconolactonase